MSRPAAPPADRDADSDAGLPAGSVLASLGRFAPPFEIDRRGGPPSGEAPLREQVALNFWFGFADVPFQGRAERRGDMPVLTLVGDLGVLPFSIQNPRKRHRLLQIVAAAQRSAALLWEVGTDHRVRISGEIELGMPLTPTAVIAGAATLMLYCRPYLELFVTVASEA